MEIEAVGGLTFKGEALGIERAFWCFLVSQYSPRSGAKGLKRG